jgi:aromatic ring hydroxylase
MIAVWASMCRAGWDRALANATTTPSGTVRPDESAVYATKAYGGERYNDMLSYLHDISGALVLTVPATADYDNQATHKYMEKYSAHHGRRHRRSAHEDLPSDPRHLRRSVRRLEKGHGTR